VIGRDIGIIKDANKREKFYLNHECID